MAAAATTAATAAATGPALADLRLGFVGTGKISFSVVTGYCSEGGDTPRAVTLSPRTREKAEALAERFPERVTVAESNQAVVDASDVVFVGLLPDTAREVLPSLQFGDRGAGMYVISMMATIPFDELCALLPEESTGIPRENILRCIPLPTTENRAGPILSYPGGPERALLHGILSAVGTPVCCGSETEMTPLVCIAGMISPFYEIEARLSDWAMQQGVEEKAAKTFVGAFFGSLAAASEISDASFSDLAVGGATPGGLNEQSLGQLREGGFFDQICDAATQLLQRLSPS